MAFLVMGSQQIAFSSSELKFASACLGCLFAVCCCAVDAYRAYSGAMGLSGGGYHADLLVLVYCTKLLYQRGAPFLASNFKCGRLQFKPAVGGSTWIAVIPQMQNPISLPAAPVGRHR
jgi:hypothetical protein